MSLTVTESQAVFDLLRWLADKPAAGFTAAEAMDAMSILGRAASRRLLVAADPKLPALVVERLQAADSDGAAQALARAADRAGYVPAPLRPALETWRRLQDVELGERLRDQKVDA